MSATGATRPISPLDNRTEPHDHVATSWVDRLNDRLGRGVSWLTLAMVLVGAYNTVARYLGEYLRLSLSSNTYIELQWYLFSVVFLLGAAYALRHDAHVRVDVIYSRLGERGQHWVNLIGTALFLLPFSILGLCTAWPMVRDSWSVREVSPDAGGLARYPIKTVILLAFALLVLQGLSNLAKYASALQRDESAEDA